MDKNIEKAIGDITIIREVIQRTQRDFSKTASFFIWIGVINLLKLVLEQFSYYFRNVNGYNSPLSVLFYRTGQVLPLVGYTVCFIFFYRMLKPEENTISKGLLKMWGIVLIGAQIIEFYYMFLLPSGNTDFVNALWRAKELIVILPVLVILPVTGLVTQIKMVSVAAGIYSIVYFFLFCGMSQVSYGTLGGRGTMVSASSISIRVVMTAGMIILGLFLKKGVSNGNKYDSGSFSDEA